MTDPSHVHAALAKVRDRFVSVLPDRKASVSELLHAIEQGRVSADCLNLAGAALHQIAGTAQTLGFDRLGNAARAGEEQIAGFSSSSARQGVFSDKLREVLFLIDEAQRQPIDGESAVGGP